MFLKQYNYKPRSGSQGEATAEAPKTAQTAAATTNAGDNGTGGTAAGRRRSSATEKFAGLSAYKRGSQDQGKVDQKAAFADQKPGGTGGVIGSMWSNFTKGS